MGAAALALAVATAGCKVAEGVYRAPGAIVDAATGNTAKKPKVDLERARQEVTALADRLMLHVEVGAHLFAGRDGTPAGARQSLIFRIQGVERALAAATEPLPLTALANMIALAAYETRTHEIYWLPRYGEADQPMLEAWRQVEADAFVAAEACLSADLVAAIREALAAWRAELGEPEAMTRAGPPRFAEVLGHKDSSSKSTSLFGALGLDPLEGLEPAAREIARARELAERGLFIAQRAPRMVAWRVELLSLQLAEQPAVASVIEDLDRTTKSAESVAATAERLPERLRVEGESLLARASAEITAQRAGIVADLERVSTPTQSLLAQGEETLDAGTRMVQALDVATKTVDTFVARVSAPDPDEAAAPEPEGPPGKPFDPVEYTELATQVATALRELDTTVAHLDQSLPVLQQSLDEAAQRVDRSIEHAYGLALRLALISVGAITAAVLLVRALGRRGRETAS